MATVAFDLFACKKEDVEHLVEYVSRIKFEVPEDMFDDQDFREALLIKVSHELLGTFPAYPSYEGEQTYRRHRWEEIITPDQELVESEDDEA